MKLSREIVAGVLGTTPSAQKGNVFVGIRYDSPSKGEVFFHDGTWHTAEFNYSGTSHPVAIFEDTHTHRPDGTPMEIEELPDEKEYKFTYYTGGKITGKPYGYIRHNPLGKGWSDVMPGAPNGAAPWHYALAYKIAQPTTLEDLVGKDGQKAVWIIAEDGDVSQCQVCTSLKNLFIKGGDDKWCNRMELKDSRWSHSPFTAYADANEFVA
jgi:hypothetical protein